MGGIGSTYKEENSCTVVKYGRKTMLRQIKKNLINAA